VRFKPYTNIFHSYEKIAKEHESELRRVGWNNNKRALQRYQYILEQINLFYKTVPTTEVDIIDIGCGLCTLYKYINQETHSGNIGFNINYLGLDISPYYIDESSKLYPNINLKCRDILSESIDDVDSIHFAILNGVFTQKFKLTQGEMDDFLVNMLLAIKKITTNIIIFNVMSPNVDYKLDASYHVEFDRMKEMLNKIGYVKIEFVTNIIPYEYFVKIYV